MEGPLVSVVMPSFNQARFISAAVESVLNQSYSNLELIIVDGGSTDGTLQILERLTLNHSARLKWTSEADNGAADAINKALRRAQGEIIGWLNSDDLYAPGAVKRAVKYFAECPEMMMVYGIGEHIDEVGRSKGTYPSKPPPFHEYVMRDSCPICQPTVFFHRDVVGEVGSLDFELSVSFDYDFWIRVWKRYPYQIGYIDVVQAYSRLHSECKTIRQRKDVALESMRVTARQIGNAHPNWFYTWLDEYFSDFPHGGQPVTACALMQEAINEARGYLAEIDCAEFDRRIERDARLRLMIDDAGVTVYPDGWVPPDCMLRIRAVENRYRAVRITCCHAAPNGRALNIRAVGSLGEIFYSKVSELGQFILNLSLPESTSKPAYWSFNIRTEGSFIPSEVQHNSTDNRRLAFKVEKVELLKDRD